MAAPLSLEEMLPCVGQGAIAIEIRSDDPQAAALCAALNHPDTMRCVTAERALLRALGGGCQLPLGACARVQTNQITLEAVSLLGSAPRRARASGEDPEALGREVAELLH
jgi:hydroxymethylbilane synthase